MKNPDFIIIGSGIAGLNFALNVAELGKVLIITKKQTVQSSTNRAQGGIAAVLDKTDDFEAHVKDTLTAGAHHNDKSAVEFMVRRGPDAIKRLIEFGVNFAHHDGEIVLTREGGHDTRRVAFVGDYTGREIENALVKNVKKHPNIELWEHSTAIDLIVENETCTGVQIIKNKKIKNIFSQFTIIATGGIGQLYKHTTNPRISTGDGLAMAIRSNAKTMDLEFIQFHPTALSIPRKNAFLLSEALRGEGAHLINEKGERFMKDIHDMAELAPRDIVARAIYSEMRSSKVFIDIRHLDSEHLQTRFPQIYSTLLKYGLDFTNELIPIAPAAHYICGGIKTNRKGRTNLKNLYAFGEVAYTGVHGANRLASNSLLEALVYSNEISEDIKKSVRQPNQSVHVHKKRTESCTQSCTKSPANASSKKPSPTLKYKQNSQLENKFITQLKSQLRNIMWEHTGIIRTPEKLEKGLQKLTNLEEKLDSKFPNNITNEKLLELRNLLLCGKAIIHAALKRKESLGTHYLENN
ncbi:L-aspartate oxidase [Candidatus Peregrinibacteria bacterium]|jgi:L-aspartate oxidase|nr:L-aspartate oxidase [Candidatus Peregrinibacteria bacterium]